MRKIIFPLLALTLLGSSAYGVETEITVRAKAHDAKFIGSAIGGIKVIVKDAYSGKVLDEGFIEGGTGNTKKLMKECLKRGEELSDEKTAKFVAKVDIDRPKKVEIDLIGPLSAGLGALKLSKELWVIPGHDIKGDGVVFEFYGLVVYPVSPAPHQFFKVGEKVKVKARIDMMCGCPIKKNGIWNADDFKVRAIIEKDGKFYKEIPLYFTGKTSTFEGEFIPAEKGSYRITIFATDRRNNTGVGITSLAVM
ncbi:hypothetical protein Dester_0019 [Desulfurobacterium thermolithotrophum DSM 11699]|uniref:Uncharacterized protein n=1 Tax=Desulfurobacterium thermolithotrophum (strain DSM 11699 / BSA) TaxID=868864 RepID=F0S0F1_DESTD|nr:hypothetical protein [Desulfurobacterium thermolithotrophum]ADY72679.1 hypothetical protein Dester_0019 [Desulfurobacterium thermolithotrophum DSM 11699]